MKKLRLAFARHGDPERLGPFTGYIISASVSVGRNVKPETLHPDDQKWVTEGETPYQVFVPMADLGMVEEAVLDQHFSVTPMKHPEHFNAVVNNDVARNDYDLKVEALWAWCEHLGTSTQYLREALLNDGYLFGARDGEEPAAVKVEWVLSLAERGAYDGQELENAIKELDDAEWTKRVPRPAIKCPDEPKPEADSGMTP